MVPLVFDIIVEHTRLKYWDLESTNHSKDHKLSLYVKHLPHKMTQN